ncbi:MAG TPA: SMP-30/gluconolactonase/LRE family protein [Rhizomicrobium sp.]
MRPAARSALTAAILVAVLVVGAAVRTLIAYGVFTAVTPGFGGRCTAIATPPGPQDIAVDEKSGLAFVSVFDRRALAAHRPSAKDGLYALALKGPSTPVRLAGTPAGFHPHGISLARTADGKLALLAINRRADGTSAIAVFDVATSPAVKLTETGSIAGAELTSPGAVAAVDAAHFYVANEHGGTTAFGRWLDDILLLPRANILYFDGNVFQIVAKGLAHPSGLALSPDGHFLYAAETYARRLDAFTRSPISGVIQPVGALDIPSGLDGLRFDPAGDLWVAGHPKAFAMAAYRTDPARPAPSQIFKVTLANGIPIRAAAFYANLGGEIGGASVAAVSGNRLLIGAPLDDHILDCRMQG